MSKKILVLCTAAAISFSLQAEPMNISLLEPSAGDTQPGQLTTLPAEKRFQHPESQPVNFTWLAADADLSAFQAPSVTPQVSRSYWQEVKAVELAQGVALYTTAPGALVRISAPIEFKQFGSDSIQVMQQGQMLSEGNGIEALASAEALKATGAPFTDGTIAMRLSPEVGGGVFTVQLTDAMEKSEATFLIQVHEPDSQVALGLKTDSMVAFHNESLTIHADFSDASLVQKGRMQGFVTSPAGDLFPLSFQANDDGSFAADFVVDALKSTGGVPGELWEVHAVASADFNGQPVFRDVRTAFSTVVPTASLDGNGRLSSDAGQLNVALGVNVASESRYELRATLFGTNAAGEAQPIALTHSANVLSTGGAELVLDFPRSAIAQSGLGAPYSLRNVELLDQGQMGLLSRQQIAASFDSLPEAPDSGSDGSTIETQSMR